MIIYSKESVVLETELRGLYMCGTSPYLHLQKLLFGTAHNATSKFQNCQLRETKDQYRILASTFKSIVARP